MKKDNAELTYIKIAQDYTFTLCIQMQYTLL